jgi:hypothetical protein
LEPEQLKYEATPRIFQLARYGSILTAKVKVMTSIELPPPPTGTDIYADRHTELVVFTVVIYAFAVLFCSLRFLSRRYSGYGFWIDDYLIIPAAVCCILCALRRWDPNIL